jgi:hypothetical protein
MNLELIASRIAPGSHFSFCKPGGRKSIAHPHLWFLQVGDRVKYAVKFADHSAHAACLVNREIEFYSQIKQAGIDNYLTSAIPRIIGNGEQGGVPYFILEYHTEIPAQKWIGHAMRSRLYALVHRWQRHVLAWLLGLQADRDVKRALGVAPGEVVLHNDLNHFNILGVRAMKVIDWENWSTGAARYLDAYHLMVMPTMIGDTTEQAVKRFSLFWLKDNYYRRACLALLSPFLSGTHWSKSMEHYLTHQTALLSCGAPDIYARFKACLDVWSKP